MPLSDLTTDTATVLYLGQRDRQEDAVVSDFSHGKGIGFAVLSDGMGGHGAGDVASKIIVSEMFSELLFSCASPELIRDTAPQILTAAVEAANTRLRSHAEAEALEDVMGGTLVTTVVLDGVLRWISVGDSPLYLFREGALRRLNENHSMASRIDLLVEKGLMDEAEAKAHPQRHCLTSALTGAAIDRIDCPDDGLPLERGDVVIMASDGLQSLSDPQIRAVLTRHRGADSRALANALLDQVRQAEAPQQDNVSIVVIRMLEAVPARGRADGALAAFGRDMSEAGRRWFSPGRGLRAAERTSS